MVVKQSEAGGAAQAKRDNLTLIITNKRRACGGKLAGFSIFSVQVLGGARLAGAFMHLAGFARRVAGDLDEGFVGFRFTRVNPLSPVPQHTQRCFLHTCNFNHDCENVRLIPALND